MNKVALLAVLPLALGACLDNADDESSIDQAATGELGLHGAPEHLFHDRGNARPGGGGGGSSPLLIDHGGPVLTTNKTMAIFWGNWSNPGDKISGLDTFFGGWGNSQLAGASTEYSGIQKTSTYLGHAIDSSTPPRKALSVSGAVAEACKITNNNPDPNGVYFIYTSTGAGHVSYCAWHSAGTCSNGAPIQVAYMPNIDGIAGCNPLDSAHTDSQHSQGLAALANVTSHELSEAITDPRLDAWYDSSGAENGDKCAWTFTSKESVGGQSWWLQQEWSNNAYNANSGSPRGCIP